MRKYKTFLYNIKYSIQRFFLVFGVLNSPLVGLKLHWYFGDIRKGTPYFLPRKWIKNRKNPRQSKYIDIKYFGINFTSLGWKTKYDSIRFEWNPSLSIVIFGKQLFIEIIPKVVDYDAIDSYWEAWLTYKYRTNKKHSKIERTKQMFKEYTCTWIKYNKDNLDIKIDYYNYILKKKYLKIYEKNINYG